MRTNDLFLTAATASMMMLAACTHDDGGSVVTTPTPASNEIVISTSASKMGITRSPEADATNQTTTIQGTLFDADETIDIFFKCWEGTFLNVPNLRTEIVSTISANLF